MLYGSVPGFGHQSLHMFQVIRRIAWCDSQLRDPAVVRRVAAGLANQALLRAYHPRPDLEGSLVAHRTTLKSLAATMQPS
jgi:glycerate-2-kinase